MKKIAVVLFNLGGPDSLDSVQPFLENLFNDPDIFKLPFQKQLAKFISKKRAPKIQNEYKLIGGRSPIGEWTELQRNKLEKRLEKITEYEFVVFTAMRYWYPLTIDIAKIVESGNFDNIILLPLYPHYSISTTGSSFNEWKRCYKGNTNKLIYINSYFQDSLYIKAVSQRIDEAIGRFPENLRDKINIVFSAHGTPVSYVKKGDPYLHEIMNCVEQIMKFRMNDLPHYLCFQSKVGPMKWLEPATDKMITDLAKKGIKHLLIVPISFVSDHIETLFELNLEYRQIAENAGIKSYIVMTGLNDSDAFIESLYGLIMAKISKL